MNETNSSKRGELFRNAIVFQVKLMADGFRDLVLIPVSLFAALIGLLRGGDEPEKEFNQVIDAGRESERWINLFGNHDVPENSNIATSIDVVFTKVEDVLKQQYKAGGTSKSAQAEIDEALQIAHQKARKSE
jgi:hypothetical protein